MRNVTLVLIMALMAGCSWLAPKVGAPPGLLTVCSLTDASICAAELASERATMRGVDFMDGTVCIDQDWICPNGRNPDCGTACQPDDQAGDITIEVRKVLIE